MEQITVQPSNLRLISNGTAAFTYFLKMFSLYHPPMFDSCSYYFSVFALGQGAPNPPVTTVGWHSYLGNIISPHFLCLELDLTSYWRRTYIVTVLGQKITPRSI